MRIGWDLDGCGYDFTRAMIEVAIRADIPGCEGFGYPDRWNTWECWGMTQDAWMALFRTGVADGHVFRVGEPVEGFVKAVRNTRERGHSTHLITDRTIHPRALQSTYEWLEEYEVPFDSLTFAKDKTAVPVELFIEDRLENYWALDAIVETTAVLFDRPWNQHPDATRVFTWQGFEEFVLGYEIGRYR